MDRNKDIDNLRGLAMLAMMVIHAISYYFSNKISFYIWDYSQWAVPVFLFCSFYIFYSQQKKIDVKKRLLRLLIPYYIFLIFYFILLFFFDKHSFNFNYLLANIFLYGGVNFNWLVLLFVYFIFLMPLVNWFRKNNLLFYGFFSLSLFSSIYFIFRHLNYRIIMWLPWSLLAFFTIFFIKIEKSWRKLFVTAGISFFIFLFLRFVEVKIGHNLSQFENKYPPTLYHLSYGIFSIIIIFWLSIKKIFSPAALEKSINFLSINSYSLFFIHILVMTTISSLHFLPPNWFLFFLEIIGISSFIQLGLNNLQKLTGRFFPVKSIMNSS